MKIPKFEPTTGPAENTQRRDPILKITGFISPCSAANDNSNPQPPDEGNKVVFDVYSAQKRETTAEKKVSFSEYYKKREPTPQPSIHPRPVEKWDIDPIHEYFNGQTVFPDEVRLDPCTKIINVPIFIQAHLETVEAQNGKEGYRPYFDRLSQLYNIMNN